MAVGGRLGASQDAVGDLVRVAGRVSAAQKLALGLFRDDIHRLTAVGDDPVDPRAIAKMQPRGVDALKGLDHRRERARARPWRRRRVGGVSVEREPQMACGERGKSGELAVHRMRHHRNVDAFEHALFKQDDLAAAAFLGRRAENHDASGQLAAHRGEAREGRKRGGADEVVAAGMAVGQRVVFGEDGDGRVGSIGSIGFAGGFAGFGAKRGLQSTNAAFDPDSEFAKRAAEQPGREALLELQFRMSMDLASKPDRLVLEPIDRTADLLMDSHLGLLLGLLGLSRSRLTRIASRNPPDACYQSMRAAFSRPGADGRSAWPTPKYRFCPSGRHCP